MRAHLTLSPVILYSVWFFSSLSVTWSHLVPAGWTEHTPTHWYGWVDWIQFGSAELDYTDCDQHLSPFCFSHCVQYLIFFSEAGTACIILASANANGPRKLERIYADLRGYRWVGIWLVIVSDFGFWCKVSCKRINLILKVHAHTLFSTPEDSFSSGSGMHAYSILYLYQN